MANWPCDNYYDSVYCVNVHKIFVITNNMKLSSNTNVDNIPQGLVLNVRIIVNCEFVFGSVLFWITKTKNMS